MNIDEALRAWDWFLDRDQENPATYDRSWIPLQTNGCGDYLVYDLNSGRLIAYWHDDDEREVEFPSIEAWARHVQAVLPSSPAEHQEETGLLSCGPLEALVILVFPDTNSRNMKLACEIHRLTELPLMMVSGMLASAGEGTALRWELSKAFNSIEQSRQVRLAGKIAAMMEAEGIPTVVRLRTESESEDVSPEALEFLALRCISPQ